MLSLVYFTSEEVITQYISCSSAEDQFIIMQLNKTVKELIKNTSHFVQTYNHILTSCSCAQHRFLRYIHPFVVQSASSILGNIYDSSDIFQGHTKKMKNSHLHKKTHVVINSVSRRQLKQQPHSFNVSNLLCEVVHLLYYHEGQIFDCITLLLFSIKALTLSLHKHQNQHMSEDQKVKIDSSSINHRTAVLRP